jgi:hypothetical protein
MQCGNAAKFSAKFQRYNPEALTRRSFVRGCDIDYRHDGSTRNRWVAEVLREILAEPQPNANTPSEAFSRVIRTLMDQEDAMNEEAGREVAKLSNPEKVDALSIKNLCSFI